LRNLLFLFSVLIAAVLLSGDVCFSQSFRNALSVRLGSFHAAKKISIDPLGAMYIIEGGTTQIIKRSLSDTAVHGSIGGYGWTDGAFDQPSDIIAPNGLDIFVADYGNHRIQRFDKNLSFVSTFSGVDEETSERKFGYVRSVALSRQGSLFIVDGENNRVLKITKNSIETTLGDIGAGKGRLYKPQLVRVLDNDNVAVLDSDALVIYDYFGNYLNVLGKGLFHHVRSFTVEEHAMYVLDEKGIYAINNNATIDTLMSFPANDQLAEDIPVDLAMHGGVLYLLMTSCIISVGVQSK
jgi:hypothetical protein